MAEIASLGADGVVFIVDDGSGDGTGGLADALAMEFASVRVLHHPENRGFSGAIASALTGTDAEFVLLIPADGQVPLEILPRFWAARLDADVVVGVRRPRADSLWRRVLSWGYHVLSRALLGIAVTEFSSTLLFRRRILDLPITSRPRSAALLAEVVARATLRGARFREVPYRHLPRAGGVPKGGDPAVALRTFFEILRLAWQLRIRERGVRGALAE